MKKKYSYSLKLGITFFLVSLFIHAQAQLGGLSTFQSLKLPPSARTGALGGYQITILDKDLSLGLQNPALINPQMDNQIMFSTVNYLSDINHGFVGYGHEVDSLTAIMGGIQYVDYGNFKQTDEFGNHLGEFSGGEYAFSFGIGRKLHPNWHGGAAFKFIYGHLESYSSLAIAFDVGVLYARDYFNAALNIKNVGTQLTSYYDTRESLPLDIQLAISQKLAKAPFRINITAHSLQVPDFTYINTNVPTQIDFETGEPIETTIPLSEKIARHFTVGGEILLSKKLHVRVGYNHQRRKEMTLNNVKGMVGYSAGFSFKVWRLRLEYGWVNYHLAGNSNHISVQSNFSEWKKKEKPKPETTE